jgi:ribosomal protein RSM22 (predicted rRNA methylase)
MASPADKRHDELERLADSVARLSRLLTRERDSLPASYLRDRGMREAYRRYFLPANLLKIHLPLHELFLHPAGLLHRDRLRVLDIGSGPGTAVLGILEFFSTKDRRPVLDITALDQVADNLKEAAGLFREHRQRSGVDASLRTIASRIEDLPSRLRGPFDAIVFSNVLNELSPHDDERIAGRSGIIDGLLRMLLAEHGSCIIIEPALRATSRDMLRVRDGLLAGGWHVYSPCLMQEPCPALVNPKDWCHEERPWVPPEVIRQIDARTGLRKDALKFSYVVLRRDVHSLSDVCGKDAFRVVSEPLVSKGKRELFLCGGGGRRLAARLDKDAAPVNETFADLRRGDVVRFSGMVNEGTRYRLTRDTTVVIQERLRPGP